MTQTPPAMPAAATEPQREMIAMPDAVFLETYPLYRRFKLPVSSFGTLSRPSVHMHCAECQSEQTFNMSNKYNDGYTFPSEAAYGKVTWARYTCAACGTPGRDR